jgi:transporter family-2 protein
MQSNIFALLAMGAGCCIALQAAANGKLRDNIHSPLFTSYFSICGTILTATVAMLLIRPPLPATADIRDTSWWNWIGGPLGALIVLAGATLTRELGAARFIAFVVGGQLLCAMFIDHFALMGLEPRAITPGRVLGALLVVVGVYCIKYL